MSSSKLVFIPSVQSIKAGHSFLTFPCFSSQGGTSKDTRRHCPLLFFFFIPTLTYFFAPRLCLSNVDIFKGATLAEMVNRCGTGSTHARLSRPKSHHQLCLLTWCFINHNWFSFIYLYFEELVPPPLSFIFLPQNSNCATARDISLLKL